MKKYYFMMAAVSAMMLTACSSEDDVLQTGQAKQVASQEVGFEIYTPTSSQTRAGRAGVMSTSIMQQTGFGVFAFQLDATDTDNEFSYDTYSTASDPKPNFMWNQQVNYNKKATGWYYSPLKYWPNETYKDMQTYPSDPAAMPDYSTTNRYVDKVTFFAYAPWVNATAAGAVSPINANLETPNAKGGITAITGNTTAGDPKISYTMAVDPDYSVDLLWGVAPVGNLNYTNVSGSTTNINEGYPLIDLVKPAVNTNIKFLFQHALARLGVKIVAAVDQVAAGGSFDYANSKITVEEIRIMGEFGTEGILNLNNTAKNVAKWTITSGKTANTDGTALKIKKDQGLAPHITYSGSQTAQQEVTGVTTTVSDAIKVRTLYDVNYKTDCATEETKPDYSATRPYFANAEDIAKTTSPYATFAAWSKTVDLTYLQQYTTNEGVSFRDITSNINTTYPNATVWQGIYSVPNANIYEVISDEGTVLGKQIKATIANALTKVIAYRRVGTDNYNYVATGQPAQVGDYVFWAGGTETKAYEPDAVLEPAAAADAKYWKAKPNYFMVIPPLDADNKTIKVRITYYVSTSDHNLEGGVVYTKNVVEKDVVLPHFVNGKAYDLKLILGLTSVKIEADVADWTTTNAEVNLPQNTAE